MSEVPGVLRRLASALYDGLLMLAVLFVASYVFLLVVGDATQPPTRFFYQLYLLGACAVYFVGFWRRGGQTLAMKTWRFKLVTLSGQPLDLRRAVFRLLLAPLGLLLFWWAWLDPQRSFLHDRLAGTRLVMIKKSSP